jgi:hypothetical protein
MSAAAEDIGKPLDVPQLSVSDAIENQLYELEARHLPTAPSGFSSALKGVTRLGEFIVRPESMTACATAAAAFAAFLAVKAAERQETATFTSALYSKQVDGVASVDTKFQEFVDATAVVNPYARQSSRHFQFNSAVRTTPTTDADYDKIYSSAYPELINAINILKVVFPQAVKPFVDKIITETNTVVTIINHMAYARASGLSRSGVQNRNTGVSCSSIWDEQDERRVWM